MYDLYSIQRKWISSVRDKINTKDRAMHKVKEVRRRERDRERENTKNTHKQQLNK